MYTALMYMHNQAQQSNVVIGSISESTPLQHHPAAIMPQVSTTMAGFAVTARQP
jgi:hypothetical protein